MRPVLATATIVGVVAAFVGLCAWAILENSDRLVTDIRSTLAYVAPEADGTLRLISDGPVSDWIAAIGFAIQLTLLGGIPAAIAGMWLSRRTRIRATRWSNVWSTIFLAGFVFQLSAILLAPVMFVAFASYVGDVRLMFRSPDLIAISIGLVFIVLCSIAALRSWMSLLAATRDDSLMMNVPRI